MIFEALKRVFNRFWGERSESENHLEYYDWLQSKPKSSMWYKNGVLHRLDGPAVIIWDHNRVKIEENWYKDGKLHRLDGPAICYVGRWTGENIREYYINGIYYTEEEFKAYTEQTKGLDRAESELISELNQSFE